MDKGQDGCGVCEVGSGYWVFVMDIRPTIMLDIEGVDRITKAGGVWVTLKGSGARVCLPQEHIDCLPGAVVIPEWLARKLKRWWKEKVNENGDHGEPWDRKDYAGL